ncbi:hypothetical protein [Dyella japonica]|uniref:hypothetical protein n=1 Tax=Dyella japonica TaxID=231455 RepID=UPI0003010E78|nr:hypothetical protein [Dyella japonica]
MLPSLYAQVIFSYEAKAVLEMVVSPHLMPAPILDERASSLGYTSLLPSAPAQPARGPIRIRLGAWNLPSWQPSDGRDHLIEVRSPDARA